MITSVLAGLRRSSVSLAVAVPLLAAAAAPASAAVAINEVQSDGSADFIELVNVDATPMDIGGYVIKDSNNGNAMTVPAGTSIPAGGYYAAYVAGAGFGLGAADSARLFAPGNPVAVDSYSWGSHALTTYGRCPDGTGPMIVTSSSTPGAENDCSPAAAGAAWPGGGAASIADGVDVFGSNLSGLAYQPSGTSAPGVLWAVRNSPSTLFRLVYDGAKWTPDTTNGWSMGKQLVYPDGTGVPDAEGVTFAGGDANGIYVATERNDVAGFDDTSRPAVLRYDVTSPAGALVATKDWNLTASLPGLDSNAGLEAVTWVPDDLLVAKGFLDEATGATYNPATYADHGAGLFFVGVEQDAKIVAYALNQVTGTFTRVATIRSGFPKIMELEYEPESARLWAVCDDTCGGRTARLDIAQAGANAGRFVVTDTFERPAGMANLNNEGFAITPQAECVNGLKPVFWTDDTNAGLHALRSGTINCTVLAPPDGGGPGGGGRAGGGSNTGGGDAGTSTPISVPASRAQQGDPLTVALKLGKSGTYAVRRTGKFGLVLTLRDRADLTIAATARKNARSRARTIFQSTRRGVAKGKSTLTLTLKRSARASLRTGETLTITVKSRDAAGNTVTRRATAKIR